MQFMSASTHIFGQFTVSATGDSLIFQRLSIFTEPEFLSVREIIQGSDVSFTNFETIVRNDRGFPRYKTDPTVWMTSPRFVVDELKWMGFRLFSLANNHSMDYGEGGLLETIRVFEESGLTHAGTGRNLSEARAPAYLDTSKARIALVAMNTRGDDGPAGDALGSVPGRPGVNPMRFTTTKLLERTDFDQLAKISMKLGLPRPRDNSLNLLGLREIRSIDRFEIGERTAIRTAPYKPDFDGNLRSISAAKRNADFVFVSVHNHEKSRPGEAYSDDTIEHVAEFVETFSRAAVDAGADAVLGHGTHVLNGVEIYKGHPIFYGLGNFIQQPYQSIPRPYDWYEARGLHERTCHDENTEKTRPTFDRSLVLTGEAEDRRVRRLTTSIIAGITYENGRVVDITVYPLELRRDSIQGGRPTLASGPSANDILNRLSRLSAPYGTEIRIANGIGKITL